jgi:uncharacterized protein
MGADDNAVVDSRLRVRGVHGLRIADVSVVPRLFGCNLNAVMMMLGCRAGDLMIDDATSMASTPLVWLGCPSNSRLHHQANQLERTTLPIHVIPMDPNGPLGEGLSPCQLIPSERILNGHGHQEQIHNYFETQQGRVSAGVWESTPCKDLCDYDVDEVCYIIRGRVRVEAEDGARWSFGPGDCFVIPFGFRGTWETIETVRKFYFIYDRNAWLVEMGRFAALQLGSGKSLDDSSYWIIDDDAAGAP